MEETKNSESLASGMGAETERAPWIDAGEKSTSSNSMQLKSRINVMKSNVEHIKQAYRELFGAGTPATMAALEAAVRERLGLAWMQRGRRKAEPAA